MTEIQGDLTGGSQGQNHKVSDELHCAVFERLNLLKKQLLSCGERLSFIHVFLQEKYWLEKKDGIHLFFQVHNAPDYTVLIRQ